jgi:hypothetical protein
LVIAGCKPASIPSYVQPANTTAVIKDTEIMPGGVKVCDVQGTDYYVKDYFIYIYTTQNTSIVITSIGTYRHNKQNDNWELIPFLDRNRNVYWDTMSWIENGKVDSGQAITCEDKSDAPILFYRFYKVYKPIYDKAKYESSKTNATVPALL